MKLNTNSATALQISSAGNVGIGTTVPSQRLHVHGNTQLDGSTIFYGATSNAGSRALSLTYGTYNGVTNSFRFRQGGSTANAVAFSLYDYKPSLMLRYSSECPTVGIGVTDPSVSLEVYGPEGRGSVEIGSGIFDGYNAIRMNGSTNTNDYNFISNSNDKNLYINRPSTHQIRFRAGNADQMILFSNGTFAVDTDLLYVNAATDRVGIGTNNPQNRFHVYAANGEVVDSYIALFENDENSVGDNFGVKIEAGSNISDVALEVNSKAGSSLMRVRGDGKVGVGTHSPDDRLHVVGGDLKITSDQGTVGDGKPTVLFSETDNSNSHCALMYDGDNLGGDANRFSIVLNGGNGISKTSTSQEKLVVNAGGDVGIGTQVPLAFDTTPTRFHVRHAGSAVCEVARFEGTSDANGAGALVRIGTSNDRGIYFEGGRTGSVPYGAIGVTEFNGAKTEAIRIESDGKVGIGTFEPQRKLHVNGHIRTSNDGIEFNDTNAYIRRTSNDLEIRTFAGYSINLLPSTNVGIGSASPQTKLDVDGTIKSAVYVIGSLPSASPAGQRAFVSNSTVGVGSTSVGVGVTSYAGGSNTIPVYSDGSTWRIG